MLEQKVELNEEYQTLEDFWPYYLHEHRHPINRGLHFIGSCFGLFFLARTLIERKPKYIFYGFLSGYAFAWIGHFIIEKNRPATFKYPLKSFVSDWKMFGAMASGKIDREMEKSRIYDHLK